MLFLKRILSSWHPLITTIVFILILDSIFRYTHILDKAIIISEPPTVKTKCITLASFGCIPYETCMPCESFKTKYGLPKATGGWCFIKNKEPK